MPSDPTAPSGTPDLPTADAAEPSNFGAAAQSESRLQRVWRNYRLRHQHPINVALHVVGVPLSFVAPIPLYVHGSLQWAVSAFLAGYVLQFAGHAIEGNDAGEVILVKKSLGIPYIDVVDRTNRSSQDPYSADT